MPIHALYATQLPAWAMSQVVLVLLLALSQVRRQCLSLSAHDLKSFSVRIEDMLCT